jgi:hypothetical protein
MLASRERRLTIVLTAGSLLAMVAPAAVAAPQRPQGIETAHWDNSRALHAPSSPFSVCNPKGGFQVPQLNGAGSTPISVWVAYRPDRAAPSAPVTGRKSGGGLTSAANRGMMR